MACMKKKNEKQKRRKKLFPLPLHTAVHPCSSSHPRWNRHSHPNTSPLPLLPFPPHPPSAGDRLHKPHLHAVSALCQPNTSLPSPTSHDTTHHTSVEPQQRKLTTAATPSSPVNLRRASPTLRHNQINTVETISTQPSHCHHLSPISGIINFKSGIMTFDNIVAMFSVSRFFRIELGFVRICISHCRMTFVCLVAFRACVRAMLWLEMQSILLYKL
ncbi:uncharacterized protein LOC127102401 [Lathyrus oleraceus]|uniref:uncharacterized protein LOC127102401 n=1 Tax=Pisum sativum TaxID=3888 RepID=UPI0021D1312E|nr:uncharacterized protein LOC127102401 [Pisum sativum]